MSVGAETSAEEELNRCPVVGQRHPRKVADFGSVDGGLLCKQIVSGRSGCDDPLLLVRAWKQSRRSVTQAQRVYIIYRSQ